MKGWAEAIVAFLGRMTGSAMSVECHLTVVRSQNVRCADEREQGGQPGGAHNDTDQANHKSLQLYRYGGRARGESRSQRENEAADMIHPHDEHVLDPELPLGSEHNCAQ